MSQLSISIHDGCDLVETRACRLVSLPNGSRGAVWRGAAYPLRAGDRIDINDDTAPPGRCRAMDPEGKAALRHALIEGADEAYLILDGSVVEAEHAAAALRAGGIEVLRSGRYLGDPVGPVLGDWFVRFVKPPAAELAPEIERLLGPASAGSGLASDEGRAHLLATELAAAKAREAGLRSEIARLALLQAEGAAAESDRRAALEAALAAERALREEAELAASRPVAPVEQRPVRTPASGKLRDEIELVLETFLPRLRLLRDSLDVIAAEFGNRGALYRGLGELHTGAEGMPANWKRIKGVDGCWERHVSNGQDDAGRIYARRAPADRTWGVLVSHKGQQSRDIAWLAGPGSQ